MSQQLATTSKILLAFLMALFCIQYIYYQQSNQTLNKRQKNQRKDLVKKVKLKFPNLREVGKQEANEHVIAYDDQGYIYLDGKKLTNEEYKLFKNLMFEKGHKLDRKQIADEFIKRNIKRKQEVERDSHKVYRFYQMIDGIYIDDYRLNSFQVDVLKTQLNLKPMSYWKQNNSELYDLYRSQLEIRQSQQNKIEEYDGEKFIFGYFLTNQQAELLEKDGVSALLKKNQYFYLGNRKITNALADQLFKLFGRECLNKTQGASENKQLDDKQPPTKNNNASKTQKTGKKTEKKERLPQMDQSEIVTEKKERLPQMDQFEIVKIEKKSSEQDSRLKKQKQYQPKRVYQQNFKGQGRLSLDLKSQDSSKSTVVQLPKNNTKSLRPTFETRRQNSSNIKGLAHLFVSKANNTNLEGLAQFLVTKSDWEIIQAQATRKFENRRRRYQN